MSADTLSIQATERLFSLFETKLHLLRELQALALEQSSLVAQHDMTALMTVLSRKQSIMESINQIQEQLAKYRDDDPEQRTWSSQERRKECQAIVHECDALVQALIVQENRSIDDMAAHKDGIHSQLQQNAAASQVQKAYSNSPLSDLDSEGGFTLEG